VDFRETSNEETRMYPVDLEGDDRLIDTRTNHITGLKEHTVVRRIDVLEAVKSFDRRMRKDPELEKDWRQQAMLQKPDENNSLEVSEGHLSDLTYVNERQRSKEIITGCRDRNVVNLIRKKSVNKSPQEWKNMEEGTYVYSNTEKLNETGNLKLRLPENLEEIRESKEIDFKRILDPIYSGGVTSRTSGDTMNFWEEGSHLFRERGFINDSTSSEDHTNRLQDVGLEVNYKASFQQESTSVFNDQ